MSVQDYITILNDLTQRSDVREHHSETITRFVWDLRPKIRHAMITGSYNCSYNLNIIEETFDVALKIDLTFKTLVNAKAWRFKCEKYRHYDYQCPSESQHIGTVPSDDVDDLKVVEDVHVTPETAS